tara:strand:- start:56 stop:382 length:327 start_codon:yes stop_codon:yes gene_type:complete
MGGKHSRNKGASFEREIVNDLKANAIKAERIPLSGAMQGFKGDIRLGPVFCFIAECKRRRKGFSTIYKALAQDNADVLFCRDDKEKTFVVMDFDSFVSLAKQPGWKDE